jgi:aspartate beta-hydroxylase
MNAELNALVTAAGAAAAAGRWQEAERLWNQVRRVDPGNVQALFSLGVHAFQRGDATGALELLQAARAKAPQDPMIPLTIAKIHGDANRLEQEWGAIMASLAIDPYFLPALLGKGEFLEKQRNSRAAAAVFRDVLKVAPPEEQWPPVLRRRLTHAAEAVRADSEALVQYLAHRIEARRSVVDSALAARWDEAVSILAGRTRPYPSQCNQLYVPRLPAQPFYDRSLFPWIPELEAQTDAIKAELEALVAEQLDGFEPYVAYKPGDPVNQWAGLNHSRDWSSYHLWAHGEPVPAHLSRCPRTAQALEALDVVRIEGLCPNAMFSALAPRTRIPPHTGETNARLVAHLPLVVPGDCSFRVGHDWREWEEGKVFAFDDSIEHEARNDGDALRVVLIFDVWNPLLTTAEREMVTTLAAAMRDYRTSKDQ